MSVQYQGWRWGSKEGGGGAFATGNSAWARSGVQGGQVAGGHSVRIAGGQGDGCGQVRVGQSCLSLFWECAASMWLSCAV